MSLLDEVRSMKAAGQLKHADLLRAGREGVRAYVEKQAWVDTGSGPAWLSGLGGGGGGGGSNMQSILDKLDELTKTISPLAKTPRGKPGPSWGSWLTPLLQPISALAIGAGAVGASKLMSAYDRHGVEDEVVNRFRREYISTGRTDEQWIDSGFERRIRGLHQDLVEIAPDVASRAPAALAAIRPVAQRPHMPHFTEAEVKDLTATQASIRSTKPAGAEQLNTVSTIFKMTPDFTDVVKRLDEAVEPTT